MLHAYRLVYPDSPHAPPQLWEWQQPSIHDGFAISRRRMTEYIGGSLRVYPLHRMYRRTLT